MHRFSLNFKNENYENEWRIREITNKKTSVVMIFALKIIGDCIWVWGKN
jgi:hypothetical protein